MILRKLALAALVLVLEFAFVGFNEPVLAGVIQPVKPGASDRACVVCINDFADQKECIRIGNNVSPFLPGEDRARRKRKILLFSAFEFDGVGHFSRISALSIFIFGVGRDSSSKSDNCRLCRPDVYDRYCGFNLLVKPQSIGICASDNEPWAVSRKVLFFSDFRAFGGGGGSVAGVHERNPQHNQPDKASPKLPVRDIDDFGSRFRHRLLGYQIVLVSFLGGLAAGAAGLFGFPLARDGRGWRARLGGGLIAAGGISACAMLWSWGLYGGPLGFIDAGKAFFRLLLA